MEINFGINSQFIAHTYFIIKIIVMLKYVTNYSQQI